MYPLDLNKCTATDVINRSAVCHPTMLIDALNNEARIHLTAIHELFDRKAVEAAHRAYENATFAASKIKVWYFGQSQSTDWIVDCIQSMDFGEKIAVYGQARKLQLIPLNVALDIIERNPGVLK